MTKQNITRAVMVAIIIGTVLNTINSYDVVLDGNFTIKNSFKIVLTYITPFCVSLYSSIKASPKH